jgi:acetate kinase
VLNGKSVDTSMGLTPTGGLVMSTRTGDLDPGVLIYLMRKEKFGADELEEFVNHECGLAGFSDGESDMQKLLARAAKNDSAAELAIAAFCVTVRKYVGAYAALMGGLDLLVFTGGIGEHSEEIRRQICDGVDFLNVSAPGGVRVMPSQEEVQIARHCRRLLAQE